MRIACLLQPTRDTPALHSPEAPHAPCNFSSAHSLSFLSIYTLVIVLLRLMFHGTPGRTVLRLDEGRVKPCNSGCVFDPTYVCFIVINEHLARATYATGYAEYSSAGNYFKVDLKQITHLEYLNRLRLRLRNPMPQLLLFTSCTLWRRYLNFLQALA